MRIGELAERLGTTTHAIRFYERHGLLPAVERTANGYREYGDGEVTRLRLLMGLRQLDLPLGQAAELAGLCAAGRCDEVSDELRAVIEAKRRELARAMGELRFLDRRLEHLASRLDAGDRPRSLIQLEKGGTP
jgi:DNA-binding transcriptional MerR regulator